MEFIPRHESLHQMLRFYGVISVFLATSLSFMMLVSQQIGKLSNAPQFAYVGNYREIMDIYLADLTHRIIAPLTRDGLVKGTPTWSSNGDLLAYGGENGIHVIAEEGRIQQITSGSDSIIYWIDDSQILFSRRNINGEILETYIVNLHTLELQSSTDPLSSRRFVDIFSSNNGEVRIYQWQLGVGGTDDLYITDVNYPFNIQEGFTFDGSACYEIEPQFRP